MGLRRPTMHGGKDLDKVTQENTPAKPERTANKESKNTKYRRTTNEPAQTQKHRSQSPTVTWQRHDCPKSDSCNQICSKCHQRKFPHTSGNPQNVHLIPNTHINTTRQSPSQRTGSPETPQFRKPSPVLTFDPSGASSRATGTYKSKISVTNVTW